MKAFRPIRNSFCSLTRSNNLITRISGNLRSSRTNLVRPSQSSQIRHATDNSSSKSMRGALDNARKDYPILFPFLLVASLGSLSLLGLMVYDEYTRVAPEYAAYPTSVEQRLRLALHYTHVRPDPDTAANYFVEAIKAAEMTGMDPFSKEAMGIRIRFAEMLEKFGRVRAAVEIINEITKDCEKKLADLDPSTQDTSEPTRKSLLRSIIQTKVKSSTLYASEYLQNLSMAKQTLSDAVELLVRETKDPKTGFEDNAAGLSMEEIAAILSQMGDLYATSGEESNAVQVYMLTLQPLRAACNGTKSCKEVQILSNIASTMDLAMKKPNVKINGRPASKDSLAAARRATLKWADQAIATADLVEPENRDEICELGLLSAQMTRADLLLDNGQKAASREIFQSLIPTLKNKGLNTLVTVAEDGFRRANN